MKQRLLKSIIPGSNLQHPIGSTKNNSISKSHICHFTQRSLLQKTWFSYHVIGCNLNFVFRKKLEKYRPLIGVFDFFAGTSIHWIYSTSEVGNVWRSRIAALGSANGAIKRTSKSAQHVSSHCITEKCMKIC